MCEKVVKKFKILLSLSRAYFVKSAPAFHSAGVFFFYSSFIKLKFTCIEKMCIYTHNEQHRTMCTHTHNNYTWMNIKQRHTYTAQHLILCGEYLTRPAYTIKNKNKTLNIIWLRQCAFIHAHTHFILTCENKNKFARIAYIYVQYICIQ